jgi:hypothetical protein
MNKAQRPPGIEVVATKVLLFHRAGLYWSAGRHSIHPPVEPFF